MTSVAYKNIRSSDCQASVWRPWRTLTGADGWLSALKPLKSLKCRRNHGNIGRTHMCKYDIQLRVFFIQCFSSSCRVARAWPVHLRVIAFPRIESFLDLALVGGRPCPRLGIEVSALGTWTPDRPADGRGAFSLGTLSETTLDYLSPWFLPWIWCRLSCSCVLWLWACLSPTSPHRKVRTCTHIHPSIPKILQTKATFESNNSEVHSPT